ncbi:MAG: DUF47 family protein [Deltaproteobacteria bacterium]|nr:DUF47 family protein [Deltaproteobacteria bacterium]
MVMIRPVAVGVVHEFEGVMLKIFFKKEEELKALVYEYLKNVANIEAHFSKAMEIFLEQGMCDDCGFLTEQTHKHESRADDIREEINLLMYGKALIPESREDIMRLLEAVDEIPRRMELVLYMIQTQKLAVPDFIIPDTRELIQVSLQSCDLMAKQIDLMLRKKDGVKELMDTIDQNESHCDHIERRIISKVFDSNLDPFEKMQLKEMAVYLGEISDQADRVSKRVNIIAIKRRV